MVAIIAGIVQILILILSNKFEKDENERKRKDELLTNWKEVAKSNDLSRINAFIDKLRK